MLSFFLVVVAVNNGEGEEAVGEKKQVVILR